LAPASSPKFWSDLKMADIVGLQCTECKRRNYATHVNKKKAQKKLEKLKHCKWCNKHTLHKETK
jgi:large subunit ribosomal protein L33